MKKFFKFLFGTVSLAAIAGGAYYIYKNYIKKDSTDDFDDFEEDFEEEEETDESSDDTENREYVSINITTETDADESVEEVAEEQ